MAKISIIIPVYNAEQYLKRCLDSIFGQSIQDIEVICINDCSTDGSAAVLACYQEQHKEQMKILTNETNLRAGLSKDRALQVAAGEFVVYCDSDDYLASDYLEVYLKEMESKQLDIVCGGYINDVDGKFIVHRIEHNIWAIATYVVAWSKMYRRQFLLDSGMHFTDLSCLEDMYFNLVGFCHHPRYSVLDYQGYYYYRNSASVTQTFNYTRNHEQIIEQAYERLEQQCDLQALSLQEQQVLEYTYIANMIHSLIVYNRHCGIANMKQKYEGCMRKLKKRYPNYRKNPYIGLNKPKGQTAKIRIAVGFVMLCNRIGLDRFGYYLLAL